MLLSSNEPNRITMQITQIQPVKLEFEIFTLQLNPNQIQIQINSMSFRLISSFDTNIFRSFLNPGILICWVFVLFMHVRTTEIEQMIGMENSDLQFASITIMYVF